MDIMAAVHSAEKWMDDIDGVIGVSQGEQQGKPAIVVFITNSEAKESLPTEFEGYPVVTEFSDEFTSY
ncbi:MAG: hypothetical protein PVI92_04475 [Chromatiales bacterium]